MTFFRRFSSPSFITKATTWDHPGRPTGELPPGWCEVADPLDARRYFFCPATRAVSWVRPTAPGSSLNASGSGSGASGGSGGSGGSTAAALAFSSTGSGALREAPQSPQKAPQLPQGWSTAFDSFDGKPYYFTDSGKTQWDFPVFPA